MSWRWVAVLVGVWGCGPAVGTTGDGASGSSDSGAPDSTGAMATVSGVPPATVGGPSTVGTTDGVDDSGASESTTAEPPPPPTLCIEYGFSSGLPLSGFADVDGDGIVEPWFYVAADGTQRLSNCRRYRVEELELEHDGYGESVDADAIGIAEIDGDGHDDLFWQVDGASWVRPGTDAGTFLDEEFPMEVDVSLVQSRAGDVDGDGDDELVAFEPGVGAHLLWNDDGEFEPALFLGAQEVDGVRLVGITPFPEANNLALSLVADDGESSMLVLLDTSSRTPATIGVAHFDAHYVLGTWVDGGERRFVVWGRDERGLRVELFELGGFSFSRTVLIDGVASAVFGAFDGGTSPHVLYIDDDDDEHRLLRLEDGLDAAVTVLANPHVSVRLLERQAFGVDGVGVLAQSCGFACSDVLGRVTPC